MWDTILGLIVTVAITVITYFVGGSLKGTKTEKVMNIAAGIIKAAVASTEQLAANKDMSSDDKKKLAMQNAKDALEQAGITLPDQVVDMMIESEVFAINVIQKKAANKQESANMQQAASK